MTDMNTFIIQSDALETSDVPICWMDEYLADTSSGFAEIRYNTFNYFMERVGHSFSKSSNFLCQRLPSNEETFPIKWAVYFGLSQQTNSFMVFSFKNTLRIATSWEGNYFNEPFSRENAIEGPPDDAWTVPGWAFDADRECQYPMEPHISEIQDEIQNLLGDFLMAKPLDRPEEIDAIADRIASNIETRKKENLDAWAEKLSIGISKARD